MLSLAFVLLLGAPPAEAAPAWSPAPAVLAGVPQSASGLVIAEDVAGHIVVVDKAQRTVFEGDKQAGRPVRISAPPGSYEVRLDARREALRIAVEVREGEFTVVDRDRFAVPQSGRSAAAESTPDPPAALLGDAVNRLEVRFGAYPTPSFSHEETPEDVHTNWSDYGLGVEYLRFLTSDLAVGFAVSTLTRSEKTWVDRDHDDEIDDDREYTRTSNSTTFVPVVVRWNFLRRTTAWRTMEPYLTGSVGAVFRSNRKTVELDDDRDTTSEGTTSIGGRIGVGLDAHLGRVVTLGVVGAWRWSTWPDEDVGYGSEDRGGEVAVTLGFEWGRWPRAGGKTR